MARKQHLHRRDLEILELLVERRAETLDYLHRAFWPETTTKTARNRLGELARAGYLERVALAQDRPDQEHSLPGRPPRRNVYLLGPKAPIALRRRSLAGEQFAAGAVRAGLPASGLAHQLATNRVGDWLGAKLIPEHLLDAPKDRRARRHRADAAYRAREADEQGRQIVLVEVDLGHYSRARILGKVQTFLADPSARSIVFATQTDERATLISRWIREQHGSAVMDRIQAFTFAELKAGVELDPGTEPTRDTPVPGVESWSELL